MTIREHIERDVKAAFLCGLSGMILIMAGVALGTWLEPWPVEKVFYAIGGVLLLVGTVRLMAGIKCPKCNHALLWSNVNLGAVHVWAIGKAAYCPYCHADFSSPMP